MPTGIVRKVKGLGGLLTAWAFVLACVGEIWKIGWVVVRDFSRRRVCGGIVVKDHFWSLEQNQ